MRRTSLATACIVLAAIGIASCGQDEAIVGGACKTGLSVCGSECVDLSSDAAHCGSCGHPCLAGDGCLDGVCAGEPTDATVRDAEADASDASSVSDVSTGSDADGSPGSPDGSPFQSESGSGGGDSAPDGTTQNPDASDASGVSDGTATDADANVAPGDATIDADACTPPFDTPDHCGSCANACTGATPRCTPSDAGFVCTPTCAAPLVDCGTGTCIDLTTDPFNCGACALICPSQLCRSSACVGATPGSLVYIGNDYAKPPSSAPQARVFSNAVFAASGSSLEVLAYERYADPNAISSASAILSAAAARGGRTLHLTPTNNDVDIPTTLSILQYDTLVVLDQSGAAAGALGALGSSWAATLASFTQSGGVVVVLDGGTGAGEMPAFLTNTGLLSVTGHAPVAAGSELDVLTPSDVVGVQVITPYGAGADTMMITTEPSIGNVVYVVAPAGDGGALAPVVVHKVL